MGQFNPNDWGDPNDPYVSGYTAKMCTEQARLCRQCYQEATVLRGVVLYRMAAEWWVKHGKAKRKWERDNFNAVPKQQRSKIGVQRK